MSERNRSDCEEIRLHRNWDAAGAKLVVPDARPDDSRFELEILKVVGVGYRRGAFLVHIRGTAAGIFNAGRKLGV